jgi:hypothetical protein
LFFAESHHVPLVLPSLQGIKTLPSDLSEVMESYPYGCHMLDSQWNPASTSKNTKNTMNTMNDPHLQANHVLPAQSDDNWTVDSADVFVRSGPNGMNRFAPWGPTRTKEIDAATTPKDE